MCPPFPLDVSPLRDEATSDSLLNVLITRFAKEKGLSKCLMSELVVKWIVNQ